MMVGTLPHNPAMLGLTLVEKATPHTLFTVLGLEFTQQMFMVMVTYVVVLAVCWPVSRRIRTAVGRSDVEAHLAHGRFTQVIEVILVFIRETMTRPHLGEHTDKYIKYVWSVFFVILFANVLGLMPIGQTVALFAYWFGASNHYEYWQFFGGPAMSSVPMTGAMATISFIAIVYIGVKENGVEFFKHFAPLPFKGWGMPMALFMVPLASFMIVLEVVGLIIRSGVLALRLFGNMVAGFLTVSAFIGLIAQFGSYFVGGVVALGTVTILFLELFVAFIQTFIFTFLTVIFIAQGAMGHEEEQAELEDQPTHGSEAATVTAGPQPAHG